MNGMTGKPGIPRLFRLIPSKLDRNEPREVNLRWPNTAQRRSHAGPRTDVRPTQVIIPVIHVIHRYEGDDLAFERLEKGDTIHWQAVDGTTRNRSEDSHLRPIRRGLVPSGNRICQIGPVDRNWPELGRRMKSDDVSVIGSEPSRRAPDFAKNDHLPSERFPVRKGGPRIHERALSRWKRRENPRSTTWPKQRENCLRASVAALAAEAGDSVSVDLRVGADRRPAPVTDRMIAQSRRPCRGEAERS